MKEDPRFWCGFLFLLVTRIVPGSTAFSASQQAPIGLYVHIPYCRQRCRYCDFAIVPIGDTTGSSDRLSGFQNMDHMYKDALLSELNLIAEKNNSGPLETKVSLCSIYFGGGTPSLAPVESLRQILSTILDPDTSPFTVNADDCEITIEVDPGTFSREKLLAIREMGFNRISLGVQSFDDNILESLGRYHRSSDVKESLAMISEVFGPRPNYSIDLISGLPGLSLAKWIETLEIAVNLEPKPAHLSVYDLQIESVSFRRTWQFSSVAGHRLWKMVQCRNQLHCGRFYSTGIAFSFDQRHGFTSTPAFTIAR
mgnify:CR=1 FL=1